MAKTPVGTFLPLTSLKKFSDYLKFMDWLKKTEQSAWLMLPISGPAVTPYRNYGIGYADTFLSAHLPKNEQVWLLDRHNFLAENCDWIFDYALYQALSEHFATSAWWAWPKELRLFEAEALTAWRLKLSERMDFYIDQQYFLANQFALLRQEAHQRQLTLIGDLPFYLSQESPLVWANQNCFLLRKNGELYMQSGVPALSDEPFNSQFWGHPLYDWHDAGFDSIIDIFKLRLKFLAQFFDLVRIDHANGFFRFGIMYPDHPSWSKKVNGPGKTALKNLLNYTESIKLKIFFENIGSETMSLEQFMKSNQIPGMSIVTLAYNLDHNDRSQLKLSKKQLSLSSYQGNQIIFTSTHDTATLISWLKVLPPKIKQKFLLLNHLSPDLNDHQLVSAIIDILKKQKSNLIIVPWQDWQQDTFRFNVPGHEELTNWNYFVNLNQLK